MKCENCGSETGTSKFCPDCGVPQKTERQCANCGATYTSRFCPDCGSTHEVHEVLVQAPPANAAEPQLVLYTQPEPPAPAPAAPAVPTLEMPVGNIYGAMPGAQSAPTPAPAAAPTPQSPSIVINNMVASTNENTNANTSNSENTNTNVYTSEHTAAYTHTPAPAQPYYPPAPYAAMPTVSLKSRAVALVLGLLFGVLGVHRFYAGKVGTGLLYLLTGGLFGIGYLIDVVMIALGSFTDKNGLPIKNWDL